MVFFLSFVDFDIQQIHFKSVPTKYSGMSVHKYTNLCIYIYIFNKCRQASNPAYLHAAVIIQFELYQEMPESKWKLLTEYGLDFEDCSVFQVIIYKINCLT